MPAQELFSSNIPNFSNGISQQPYNMRLSTQGEAQENGLSSVSLGLQKRPPSQHLKKLSETKVTQAFTHAINRDADEHYQLIITNGNLKVFDFAGVEKTVNFPNGKTYLSTTEDVSESFAATSVADYTFIANKTIKVMEGTYYEPAQATRTLLVVKLGNYGKNYSVLINGNVVATYTTVDGSGSDDAKEIGTDYIALQLYNKLTNYALTTVSFNYNASNVYTLPSGVAQGNLLSVEVAPHSTNSEGDSRWSAYVPVGITWLSPTTFALNAYTDDSYNRFRINYNSGGANPYNAVLNGSIIQLTIPDNYTISTEDGFGNTALVAIRGKVQKFSDLPANPKSEGVVVEVAGSDDGSFDNYWVKHSGGNWKECVKPGARSGMLKASLPHILVREANGTFTFKQGDWAGRSVGDEETIPDPSFVGRIINHIFFYQNRLGVLSDENVIFSEAGEFFNFYRTTLTTLLDSEPIDVATTHTKVSILKHAVPFERQLFLFSEQSQFALTYTEILSPKTVNVKLTTEHPCNPKAAPVVVGKNIYFSTDRGNWSSIHEFYTDASTQTNDIGNVTGQVPKYIPSSVIKLTSSHNEGILAGLSKDNPSALFVYKYYWSGSEKLQSSWSKWTFGDDTTILAVDFIDSDLMILFNRNDGLYLEKIDVSPGSVPDKEPYLVHLDRKVTIASSVLTYDEATNKTLIPFSALPYTPTGAFQAVILSGAKKGNILNAVIGTSSLEFTGNQTGSDVVVGQVYTFKYTMSPILPKISTNSGQRAITEGRLQLRSLFLNYTDSGRFKVQVTPVGRQTNEYVFAGKILGLSTTFGDTQLLSGRFVVPILTRNLGTKIDIINDTPMPCAFLGADWEGLYVKRASPM